MFTSICAVIAIITGNRNSSLSDSLEVFILCFLLGNAFGMFIWFIAIRSAYEQVIAFTKFYDSIPKEIKDLSGLMLVVRPQNPKYHFLNLEILDTASKQPYLFNFDKKYIWITIINDLSTVKNFQKRMIEIHKRYKNEQIVLTGWGLRKNIKKKEWNMITYEKVLEIFEKLKTISNNENLIVMNRE